MNFDLVESFFLVWIIPQMLAGMALLVIPGTRSAMRQLLASLSSSIVGSVLSWSVPCFFLFPVAAWLVPAIQTLETWVLLWVLQASVLAILCWVGGAEASPSQTSTQV